MKKLLVLFIVLSTSCSKDDVNQSSIFFSPPTWIQGTWSQEVNGEVQNDVGFKFTDDDFCVINSGVTTQCYNSLLKMNEDNGVDVDVTEVSSDTQYKIDITAVFTSSFNFIKISDVRFKWIVGTNESTFLKQ